MKNKKTLISILISSLVLLILVPSIILTVNAINLDNLFSSVYYNDTILSLKEAKKVKEDYLNQYCNDEKRIKDIEYIKIDYFVTNITVTTHSTLKEGMKYPVFQIYDIRDEKREGYYEVTVAYSSFPYKDCFENLIYIDNKFYTYQEAWDNGFLSMQMLFDLYIDHTGWYDVWFRNRE